MAVSRPLSFIKDLALPILALLVSVAALINSFQTSSRAAAPNVQLLNVYAQSRTNSHAEETEDRIIGYLTLKNYGKAAVQLVNVRSEPIARNESLTYISGFYLSDEPFITTYQDALGREALDAQIEDAQLYWSNPVLGIRQPLVNPGETRELQFVMVNTSKDLSDSLPSLRIILTFSNGQDLVILPQLEYMGGGTTFGTR